jgi:hypothetical protein
MEHASTAQQADVGVITQSSTADFQSGVEAGDIDNVRLTPALLTKASMYKLRQGKARWTQLQSKVLPVEPTPEPPAPEPQPLSEEEQKALDAKRRTLPEFAGPSTRLTQDFPYRNTQANKPLKSTFKTNANTTRLSLAKRRAARNPEVDVDEELAYYLQGEALFRVRTPELMQTLAAKGKRFLEKYDTADISYKQRTHMITEAVGFAMTISEGEQEVRQLLKEGSQEEERAKQAKLITKGVAGHTGFSLFKTRHTLPSTK